MDVDVGEAIEDDNNDLEGIEEAGWYGGDPLGADSMGTVRTIGMILIKRFFEGIPKKSNTSWVSPLSATRNLMTADMIQQIQLVSRLQPRQKSPAPQPQPRLTSLQSGSNRNDGSVKSFQRCASGQPRNQTCGTRPRKRLWVSSAVSFPSFSRSSPKRRGCSLPSTRWCPQ